MVDLVKQILTGQFAAALCMLNRCIEKCPPEHWDSAIGKYPFWQVVYHTLCFVDLYLSPDEKTFQVRDGSAGAPGPVLHPAGWKEFDDEYPSRRFEKNEMLEYVAICRQKMFDTLAGETRESLEGGSGQSHLPFRAADCTSTTCGMSGFTPAKSALSSEKYSLLLARDGSKSAGWARGEVSPLRPAEATISRSKRTLSNDQEKRMKYRYTLPLLGLAITATVALAQAPQDKKPTAPAQPPAGHDMPNLPPGWTESDMQACMEAATPGEMHAHLAESVGTWEGKSKMWMAPGAEVMNSVCTSKVTAIMDGRYTRCEIEGDMPGMGPFSGFGIYGFDNVSQKFQSTWIDNCGTGMMQGTGDLSSDGKTLTWKYAYYCPITKKPTTMREIERFTGKDTKTLEMHGVDPKSGKEFKMMEIAFTRTAGGGDAHASLGMISDKTVDAGCSMCVFHVSGAKSCSLALKLDGKTYMVNGAKVDAHQFCGGAKKAVVSGHIEGDKFVATKFDVKPATP